MASVTKILKIDVAQKNVFQTLVVKQGDELSRFITATLANEGVPIEIASGSTVCINVERSDGESNAFNGTVNSDGSVTVPIPAWLAQTDGKAKCSISVVDVDSRKLSTTQFAIEVEASEYSGDDIQEDENYGILVDLLATVATYTTAEEARAAAELLRASAETSRETAESTRESNESTRQSNENTRQSNESDRSGAETTRGSNESTRQGNESTRESNEQTRQSDEQTRQSNEQTRQNNETARQAAIDTGLNNKSSNVKVLSEKAIVDNFTQVHKITSQGTTLGDVSTLLNTINANGEHVLFDVSTLGASMYVCTIYINTTDNVYRIFDLVTQRISEGIYDATKLLSMAIANASEIATQAQVDYLQEQIDELGGTHIVKNWEELGDLIQSGASTNVISAGDKIDVNWIKTVLGTTTSGLTVSCSDMNAFITKLGKAENGTYLFVYNGTTWTYEETAITISEWGLSVTGTIPTGEVMTIVTTVDSISYDFVGYDDYSLVDDSVLHNWCLEQTYSPSIKAYDTYEALFSIYEGKTLPAGKYKLTVPTYYYGENRTIYFEILSALTASATKKIQLASTGYKQVTLGGGSKYVVKGIRPYEINDNATDLTAEITCYYDDTVSDPTLYTDLTSLNVNGQDPIIYVGDSDKAMFGSNTWEYSNMRLWLNKTTNADDYVASHPCDRPSSYNKETGFLWGIDPRVLALIQTCKIKYTAGYGNKDKTQGTTYECNDKVFLLSMREMSFDINSGEGNATDLYSEYCNNVLTNGAVVARAKYNKVGGTINSYRWSRSAIVGYASFSRVVLSSGSSDGNGAFGGLYYSPAFIIGKGN